MKRQLSYFAIFLLLFLAACTLVKETTDEKNMSYLVTKEGVTETPFENEYWDEHRPGIYVDVNTGEPLFSSLDKFDSGTGWPSFTRTINEALVQKVEDKSLGITRTEVRTNASHLGHVFDDGPDGLPRFCINSAALRFVPFEKLEVMGYGEYKDLFPYEEAIFAGGCFWGVEYLLESQEGVIEAVSGYTGGKTEYPTYKEVSTGLTGHAESVLVIFDQKIISYDELLDIFWRLHDPTQKNRQGWDIGTQYRSAIFYFDEEQKELAEKSKDEFDAKKIFEKPAVTEITKASAFYPAEEYHQDYSDKNPSYVCHELRDE